MRQVCPHYFSRPPCPVKAKLYVRKVRVLIVSPPALSQLIQHLFRGETEFEIVRSRGRAGSVARQVSQQRAELIVACVKPVGAGLYATALAIRQSSPRSKLILVSPVPQLAGNAHKYGADSCLDQEKLVAQLLPTAWTLSEALTAPRRAARKSSRPFQRNKPT
jgi:hypothetical protein